MRTKRVKGTQWCRKNGRKALEAQRLGSEFEEAHGLSPPSPVPFWIQWSNELAREMYMKHALQRLELQYPADPPDS